MSRSSPKIDAYHLGGSNVSLDVAGPASPEADHQLPPIDDTGTRVNGSGPGSCSFNCGVSSIQDPTENASAHGSPPTTDPNVTNVDEPDYIDGDDSDASLKVSDGGNLRVRIFFFRPRFLASRRTETVNHLSLGECS